MADESTLTVAHSYSDENGVSLANFGVADLGIDAGALTPSDKVVTIATSESAIDLDGLTAAGALFMGVNLDDTNYIEIRMASGASNDHVQVKAGEPCVFRFGSDVTAPYWIANSASVKFRYRLVP